MGEGDETNPTMVEWRESVQGFRRYEWKRVGGRQGGEEGSAAFGGIGISSGAVGGR